MDGMFLKLLQPYLTKIYPVRVEEVRQHTQKETRIIDTLEPVMNQHRLIVDPMVIQEDYDTAMRNYPADKARDYMVMYQLSRITKDKGSLKHDDRLDSLAIAVKYFTDKMNLDQEQAAKIREQQMFHDMLDKRSRRLHDGYSGSNKDTLNCVERWRKDR